MRRVVLLIATAVATLLVGGQALAATGVAPGAPGSKSDFAPADKHGFGTSRTLASKVWFTLESGELTEVYYPRLDTPSYRDLQFVVTDGHSFAEREQDSTVQRTVRTDPGSLTYRQVNTDKAHRWRLTKTYVTDPTRLDGVDRRPLPVADRSALPRVRARRPRAVEQRRR